MNKYGIILGEEVYLKTDREQQKRIVTQITERDGGWIFNLSLNTSDSWHYGFEISKERDIILATSN